MIGRQGATKGLLSTSSHSIPFNRQSHAGSECKLLFLKLISLSPDNADSSFGRNSNSIESAMRTCRLCRFANQAGRVRSGLYAILSSSRALHSASPIGSEVS